MLFSSRRNMRWCGCAAPAWRPWPPRGVASPRWCCMGYTISIGILPACRWASRSPGWRRGALASWRWPRSSTAICPHLSPALIGAETSTALATGFTLIVITYLLVVLSELVPKAIALQYTDHIALLVAKPIQLAVRVFTPLVWSMTALGNGVLRLLRLPPPEAGDGVYSVEELQLLIVQ